MIYAKNVTRQSQRALMDNVVYTDTGHRKHIAEGDNLFENACDGLKSYKKFFHRLPESLIDIGAHIGGLTLAAMTEHVPYILAIEADRENYEQLIINVNKYKSKINYRGNIKCLNVAFCDQSAGEVELIEHNSRGGQSSLCFSKTAPKIKLHYTVKYVDPIDINGIMSVLDNDGIDAIDLFKCDIEGGEFTAMPINKDTKQFLARMKYIDIEIHSLTNADYFDADNFYKTLPEYDKSRSEVTQFLEFIESCGFYVSDMDKSFEWWLKLLSHNKQLKIPEVKKHALYN